MEVASPGLESLRGWMETASPGLESLRGYLATSRHVLTREHLLRRKHVVDAPKVGYCLDDDNFRRGRLDESEPWQAQSR